MDDLEKKDGMPEEEKDEKVEENTVEDNSAPAEDEVVEEETEELSPEEQELNELDKIVNSIRVKNEADILKNNVQDWSGLVDESKQEAEEFIFDESQSFSDEKLESIEKKEIDEDDETLCCICHRRARLVKDGVEYEYCGRCRKELIDTKYNWKSVVTFILSIGLAAVAVIVGFIASANVLSVASAKNLVNENKNTSALNYYRGILDEAKSETANQTSFIQNLFTIDLGEKTVRDFLDLEYKMGYVHNVDEDIKNYLPGIDLDSPKNAKLKKYTEEYKEIYDFSQEISSTLQEFQQKKDATVDELKQVIEGMEKYKKNAGTLKAAFVAYYQYYICLNVENTEDLQLKYLNEMKERMPDANWMHQLSFAQLYLLKNDNAACIRTCDAAISENKENIEAYRMKMKALYRSKKYDEALKISQQAIDIANNMIPSASDEEEADETLTNDIKYAYGIYYEQSIVYCLKGEMQKAQKAIENSYKGSRTLDSAYIFCIINKLNGNDEAYNEVHDYMKQYGYDLPENAVKIIDGKASFEEVFVTGKAAWY